jgi:integrase
MTFSEFWKNEYLPAAVVTKTSRTIEAETAYYRKWIEPLLGEVPLRDISLEKLETLMLQLQKAGKRAGTIWKVMGTVSQVWNKAAFRDIVQGECPCRRLKKPRQDNRRMRFLTRDEAEKVLTALAVRSADMHDEALLSLLCGLRAGDIHTLTWGDVDMKNKILLIRDPKNKRNRHAFMTKEVVSMLQQRNNSQATTELIFQATNGKPRKWVSDTFARTIDELGLNNTGEYIEDAEGNAFPVRIADARQRVVFHTLRHTFASWLVQGGTPLYTVAELMGHSSLEMTQRYSHLAPDTLRKAALMLEGALKTAS